MSSPQIQLTVEMLLGTWRLVACEARAADGSVVQMYSDRPEGMLMYNSDGTMMVIIMRPDRPLFGANDQFNGSNEEIRAAFNGFLAYCGRFTLDAQAGTVTHHLEQALFPNWIGTDQVRLAAIIDGQLSLSSQPILTEGKERRFYLIWKR